jgi:hypothetical protein
LERVREEWQQKWAEKGPGAAAHSLDKSFGPRLRHWMEYCEQHPEELSKVASVQKKVGVKPQRRRASRGCMQGHGAALWLWAASGGRRAAEGALQQAFRANHTVYSPPARPCRLLWGQLLATAGSAAPPPSAVRFTVFCASWLLPLLSFSSPALPIARWQVDEVKNIMVDNIEKVLERGEKIELLVDKTDNLRFQVGACP